MKLLWEAVISELEEDIGRIREAKEICISSGGPYLYEEALDSDLELLEFLINKGKEQDFDEISAFLSNLSFAPFFLAQRWREYRKRRKSRSRNLGKK